MILQSLGILKMRGASSCTHLRRIQGLKAEVTVDWWVCLIFAKYYILDHD